MLALVPSHRLEEGMPGLDHTPQYKQEEMPDVYGDYPQRKEENVLRIGFQNIRGVPTKNKKMTSIEQVLINLTLIYSV
jgi:hypothetical protein